MPLGHHSNAIRKGFESTSRAIRERYETILDYIREPFETISHPPTPYIYYVYIPLILNFRPFPR